MGKLFEALWGPRRPDDAIEREFKRRTARGRVDFVHEFTAEESGQADKQIEQIKNEFPEDTNVKVKTKMGIVGGRVVSVDNITGQILVEMPSLFGRKKTMSFSHENVTRAN